MELTRGFSGDVSWEERRQGGPGEQWALRQGWDFIRPIETAARRVAQREMFGVVGQQSPLGSTAVTEPLLCARHCARGWAGTRTQASSLVLLPAGSMAPAESPLWASCSTVIKRGLQLSLLIQ